MTSSQAPLQGLVLGYTTRHPFSLIPLTDRASVQHLLHSLLDPLEPFFSPLKSRIRIPGATAVRFDQTASEIEGLCRPLWGLACLLAGGGEYHGTHWWIDGIRAGTEEGSEEYWGWPTDSDQRMVEMCPLGFALAVVPGIWEGFAIHFLQLLYANLAAKDDPERAEEFKKRAQMAALDLAHYYDEEGRAIPFGRSVGYRFAMVSFWGALAYANVELPAPLTWGMVKGIVMRNLRWWQTQDDIWSSSGTLTIGYSYPNMYYWACLAFICLAVPETHPFWTSLEENHWDVIPKTKALNNPGHIMSNLGGHCMLLSSGQACSYPMKGTHAKYGAFAYSSAYAYSVPTGPFTLEQYSLASQLGLSDDGGESWKTRRLSQSTLRTLPNGDPILVSHWTPFPDVHITTYLLPPTPSHPNWHIRAHHIHAEGREVMTADGSFAICSVRAGDGRNLGVYDP
ncbi:hypothetical protein N0V88_001337 [Collariella sp. IMI 366227]|nr:hypothetical protein N0V88_001337 [Collariella sp. IMI 366227]